MRQAGQTKVVEAWIAWCLSWSGDGLRRCGTETQPWGSRSTNTIRATTVYFMLLAVTLMLPPCVPLHQDYV